MPADLAGMNLRAIFIIYAAFILALFVYLGLIVSGILPAAVEAESVADLTAEEAPPEGLEMVPLALVGLSVWSAFLAFVFGAVLKPKAATSPQEYLGKVNRRLILQAAMIEAIGIYALVGQFVGMSRGLGIGLCVSAFVLMLALYPGLLESADVYRRMLRDSRELEASGGTI